MGTPDEQTAIMRRFRTESPDQTLKLAQCFAHHCQPNDVVGLSGTLGAGKTCFTRGLARGLGVKALEEVTSPTFVLHQRYQGNLTLHHFDAYRLKGADSMVALGCDDIFADGGVSVIEWADHVLDCLPSSYFLWTFRITGCQERQLVLHAHGKQAKSRIHHMCASLHSK